MISELWFQVIFLSCVLSVGIMHLASKERMNRIFGILCVGMVMFSILQKIHAVTETVMK